MVYNARRRAKKAGVPFTITKEDLEIPSHCPVLGIPIFTSSQSGGNDNSPSLDRILPDKGYVRGNIIIISNRANRLKSDASIRELRDIASFYAVLRNGVRVTGGSQEAT